MDVTFAADVLDVDLLQSIAPTATQRLAAAALVSGKVSLIDYSGLESASAQGSKAVSSSEDDDDTSEGASAGSSGPKRSKRQKLDKSARPYTKKWTVKAGGKSCRAARFSPDGASIYAISKDLSIARIDVETGIISQQWKSAHDAAPSCILPISDNFFATGDDDGVIKMWDPRRRSNGEGSSSTNSWTHHSDWVTDMIWRTHLKAPKQLPKDLKGKGKAVPPDTTSASRSRLLCVSGDGTLSVIDPRASKKGVECSADQEDELLSVRAIKGGDKIVVGTSLGPLSIWAPKKGLLDHVDRLAGHPASVDSLDVLDEDTLLTGSSDGLVRIVQVYPHKLLGVAADHGGFPVERAVQANGWLASIGHEPFVRFTNLKELLEGSEDEDEADDDAESSDTDEAGSSQGQSSGTESDDSEDEAARSKTKKITIALQQATKQEEEGRGFFDDL